MSKLSMRKAPEEVTHEVGSSVVNHDYPTANLLPPSVVEAAVQRRLLRQFGAAAVGVLVLSGGLYLAQSAQIAAANGNLEKAEARGVALAAEQAEFAPVADYYRVVDEQKTLVTTTMAGRIDHARVVDGLQRIAPVGLGLQSVSIAGAAGSTGCPGPDPFTAATPVGCVTLVGQALDVAQVGVFLDRLKTAEGFDGAFVASANSGEEGVQFSGTVAVTEPFKTKRFAAPTAEAGK